MFHYYLGIFYQNWVILWTRKHIKTLYMAVVKVEKYNNKNIFVSCWSWRRQNICGMLHRANININEI